MKILTHLGHKIKGGPEETFYEKRIPFNKYLTLCRIKTFPLIGVFHCKKGQKSICGIL